MMYDDDDVRMYKNEIFNFSSGIETRDGCALEYGKV